MPPSPLVVPLRPPSGELRARAAFTLALGGLVLFASSLTAHAVFALQALGVATVSFAAFLFYGALRVRAWDGFAVRVGERAVELPVRPLARRETARVSLEDIELVSYAASGRGPRLEILARGGFYVLPFAWFPAGAAPAELALRLHVRSQLARSRHDVSPAELAALEATMIAGKSFGAFVVERLGEPPEVVATLDRKEEEGDAAAALKGTGAKLYDCAARIRALREALERGLPAPALPAAPALPDAPPKE